MGQEGGDAFETHLRVCFEGRTSWQRECPVGGRRCESPQKRLPVVEGSRIIHGGAVWTLLPPRTPSEGRGDHRWPHP